MERSDSMHSLLKSGLRVLLFIILACLIWGCGPAARTQMKVHTTKPLNEKMEVSADRTTETEWVGNATPFTLVQVDNSLKASPNDIELLVTAAQLYHGHAFAVFEDTDKKRAGELYKKSRDYALRALKQNEVFKNALNKTTEDFVHALNTFDKKDVPALYFAANSWLSWINIGSTEALADISKVLAMMDRVMELDDEFNYGGIHALRGAWLASRPIMSGGKPEEAKFHFDEAIKIAESRYLLWQLLYAKYYAVQIRDRQLFVTTLEKIISAPENLFPEKNFDNVIAKQKARVLLAKVDEYFRPKPNSKRGGP